MAIAEEGSTGTTIVTPQGETARRWRNWSRDPHTTVRMLDVAARLRFTQFFGTCARVAIPQGMGCRVGLASLSRFTR